MANPLSKGRMIRRDISRSKRVAKLSPKALSLFCLILPHLDSFGKSNGDPGYVKAEMAPLITWLTISVIRKCLIEIDTHTNLRWFQGDDGTWYLHAVNWREHQFLREDRLGTDTLPSHPSAKVQDKSGSSPGVVPHEVEVEVQGEEEVEGEVELEAIRALPSPPSGGCGAAAPKDKGNGFEEGGIPSGFLAFVEGLSLMKRTTFQHALDLSSRGDKEGAMRHIKAAMFKGLEFDRAAEFIRSERDQ